MNKNKTTSASSSKSANQSSTQSSNRPSSYTKLSYIQKVSRINRKLRTGDISRVANETGYSTTHVSDVVSGKYINDTIVNRIYDVTRGRVSNAVKLSKMDNA
jgi:hypothetical protein